MNNLSYITFIVYLEEEELQSAGRLLLLLAEHYSENSVVRDGNKTYAEPPIGFPGGTPGTSIGTPQPGRAGMAPSIIPPATPPTTAATAAQVPGIERDSAGLPWDARIHSKTKKLLVSGQWRKKRNVAPTLTIQVEGELRAAMAAPGPVPPTPAAMPATPAPAVLPATPPGAIPPQAPIAPPAAAPMAAPPAAAPPAAAPMATPPAAAPMATPPAAAPMAAPPAAAPPQAPPAAPPVAEAIVNLGQLVDKITAAGLDTATVETACQQVGVQTLPLLGTRADLIPTVASLLGLA